MPFQNPVCCTTDLCNGGETPTPEIQPPTAVSPPVTEPWPEAPKPEQNTPSPVTPTKADVDNDKTTLFIIAGAVGVFVMVGLIVYGVFSRRKRNATGRNVTIEEAENLISGDDLENGDEIRGHGSGSIVRSVTRKGTKYALKKSYNADTYEEYKILAKLDHPNILKVYEFAAKSDSKAGLLTELCDGSKSFKILHMIKINRFE
jgi:serine/threonine protein kinase